MTAPPANGPPANGPPANGPPASRSRADDALLATLHEAADAVALALRALPDWGLAGTSPGQHLSDLAADAAALEVLSGARLAVMSEESGSTRGREGPATDPATNPDPDVGGPGQGLVVVLDPLDGSTNAASGIPWYATSLCAVDAGGPRVAVVVNQASGVRFEAVRGGGSWCDGRPLRSSGCVELGDALVGLSSWPSSHFGWRQFRALGASALDICAVAAGVLDGFVDCGVDAHGAWDYLGGLLICQEAGGVVADAHGRELVTLAHRERRTPVAAATPELLRQLLAARSNSAGPKRS